MAKANPPVDLTPELWLVKMILGGIDASCQFYLLFSASCR